MLIKTILKTFGLGIGFVIILTTMQCARKTASTNDLPKSILGISVGMNKDDAENHLKEIGKMIRQERKQQEVWALKEGLRFGHLAVGYDRENRVNYVTAIAKPGGETAMKPEEAGLLTVAEKETNGPNYKYTWQVAAAENQPAYLIVAQGNQPENLSLYTMSAPRDGNSAEESEEEREKEEKEREVKN